LAYGIGGNGTLALGAGAISFTNDPGSTITSAILETLAVPIPGSTTVPTPGIIVPAGLVSQGGFSSYSFVSATDVTIPDGVQLLPTQKVLASGNIQKLIQAPSGSDIYTFTTPTLLPEFERKPASLTLTANSMIFVSNGASIQTDPGASLTFQTVPLVVQDNIGGNAFNAVSPSSIIVLGTLNAPAGRITLDAGSIDPPATPANNSEKIFYNTIYLGPDSVITARGAALLTVDQLGHRVGNVLNGGTVTVQNTLDFIAEPGSVIDVSGVAANLDLATGRMIGLRPEYAPTLVASNGGSINLSAFTGLFLDGVLLGRPGDFGNPAGSVATGGTLTIQANGAPVPVGASLNKQFANGGLIISQDDRSPVAGAPGTFAPRATDLMSVTVELPVAQSTVPLTGYTAYGAGGLPFDTTHTGSLGAPTNPGGYTLYGTGGLPFDARHPQPPGYSAYYYKDYSTLYYKDASQLVTNQLELGDIFNGSPTYVVTYITPSQGGEYVTVGSQPSPTTEVQLSGGSNLVEVSGAGFVNAQTLEGGAFDTVSLKAHDFIQFSGDPATRNTVSLGGINNLEIHAPNLTATSGTTVNLSADHLWLDGNGNSTAVSTLSTVLPGSVGSPAAPVNNAVLNVHAGTLDLDGFGSGQLRSGANLKQVTIGTPFATQYSIDDTLTSIALPSIGKINFVADQDIRFVAPSSGDNSIVLNGPVSFQLRRSIPCPELRKRSSTTIGRRSRPTPPRSRLRVRRPSREQPLFPPGAHWASSDR